MGGDLGLGAEHAERAGVEFHAATLSWACRADPDLSWDRMKKHILTLSLLFVSPFRAERNRRPAARPTLDDGWSSPRRPRLGLDRPKLCTSMRCWRRGRRQYPRPRRGTTRQAGARTLLKGMTSASGRARHRAVTGPSSSTTCGRCPRARPRYWSDRAGRRQFSGARTRRSSIPFPSRRPAHAREAASPSAISSPCRLAGVGRRTGACTDPLNNESLMYHGGRPIPLHPFDSRWTCRRERSMTIAAAPHRCSARRWSAALGRPLRDYARDKLFNPIDMAQFDWDDAGVSHKLGAFGSLRLRPRDMAKLGQLMLSDGQWKGRQVLPPGWVAELAKPRIAGASASSTATNGGSDGAWSRAARSTMSPPSGSADSASTSCPRSTWWW